MSRKTPYEIAKEILELLKRENELSIKSISLKIGSQWDTTENALDFLKVVGLVKERFGALTYKKERLFSLK